MSWSRKINTVFITENYKNQRDKMDLSEINKLEQAIDAHGYRGKSKMKHNGVVNIKNDDKELWKSIKQYNQVEEKNMNLYINDNKLKHFVDVKIVAHCPNGNRGVGSLYSDENGDLSLILLGFANYGYKLFK